MTPLIHSVQRCYRKKQEIFFRLLLYSLQLFLMMWFYKHYNDYDYTFEYNENTFLLPSIGFVWVWWQIKHCNSNNLTSICKASQSALAQRHLFTAFCVFFVQLHTIHTMQKCRSDRLCSHVVRFITWSAVTFLVVVTWFHVLCTGFKCLLFACYSID